MNKPDPFRVQCRICLVRTNHHVLYSTSVVETEQHGKAEDERTYTYNLIQCSGCNDIRLQVHLKEYTFGQRRDYDFYYPPNQVRHFPDWVYLELRAEFSCGPRTAADQGIPELIRDIQQFLSEIYQALGGGSYRLAMMGIRALIERIMNQEVGDRHSFERTIKAFFDKGHVAVSQQAMFREALIEAGHAAMHRAWKPKQSDVFTLLDIVESLIKSLYVDQMKGADVARRIPPRVPRLSKPSPSDD